MKKLLILILFCLSLNSFSQRGTKINLLHQAIGDSGVKATIPEGMQEPQRVLSEDSSLVYMSKFKDTLNGFTFSYIVIKFKDEFDSLRTDKQQEALVKSYLEFLKDQFYVINFWGYGSGYKSEFIPGAFAVIDFWLDEEDNSWAVKAWISRKYLAVMMVSGKGDYPVFDVRQSFFDGVRFN